MRINHNLAAANTHRQLTGNTAAASKSLEKLSSGLRINRAGDDAAGLAISEKMRAQIRGLDMASKNAQDGISLIQTAEGALNETHSILQRMRELADQSANGTNTNDDRTSIQDEVKQLKSEIDRIGNTTEFNTQKLLNGALKGAAGGSVGQNVTTGAVVAKLSGAKISGGTMIGVAPSGYGVKETINVDGTNITVDWSTLTSNEKSILSGVTAAKNTQTAAVDLIVSKINEAIDKSGVNVGHITGYAASGGKMVLESSKKGDGAKISGVTGSGVFNVMSATPTGVSGLTVYAGASIPSGAALSGQMKIGNINLTVNISGISGGVTSMKSGAVHIASGINAAISGYNTSNGYSSGDANFIEKVSVTVSNDGRFQIASPTGPISFTDKAGQTGLSDLGLSSAQTEAAGGGGMTFQIGANRGQTITFSVGDMRSAALGIDQVDVSTANGAAQALDSIDNAIKNVSSQRSKMGAVQNRLEHTINNLQTASENLTGAESRIRDVDMAKEMMDFTKNNILSQAAQAMLAQANQQPQGVLQLLR